jgi:hypothetical protein
MWFDVNGLAQEIGELTPDGVIKEFTYPNAMPQFEAITPGTDGNIWITDRGQTPAIAKITPSGTITPYTIGAFPNTMPDKLTPGPDNKIVRALPAQPSLRLGGLLAGRHTFKCQAAVREGQEGARAKDHARPVPRLLISGSSGPG